MAVSAPSNELIIDDREAGLFRVRRSVFTDPSILESERRNIFEKCWLYVGHESEVPNLGDFRARRVAGRPVVMVRGNDGALRVLLNTCTHRGAMVCRERQGNAKTFQCFYHAWTFDNEGTLVGVPGEDAYGPGFERRELALKTPAHTDSYRGFVFINFDRNAPELLDYLAGAKEYLDIISDQGEPDGLEIVSGSQEYCFHANWKLLVENSIDGYHALTTHYRYFKELLPDIGIQLPDTYDRRVRGGVARSLGNGHTVMESRTFRSLDEFQRQDWEARYGRSRADRMLHNNHNVLIFPNLILINIWRTVRTFFPISPNEVEITAWALMPKGDTRETRRERIDNFLSFLGPGGFATPDDAEGLESCQRGFANREVEWSDISRGMTRAQPVATDELQMQTFWRRWNELMRSVL